MMNSFLYAMQESYDKMKIEIKDILSSTIYSEEEKNKIFFVVGTCLHYILDYAERVEIDENNKSLISAFRYANNSLKHGVNVTKITKHKGGMEFPIEFPLIIPEKQIVWDIIDNGEYPSQRDNYKKHLDGKNVIATCDEVIEILKNCIWK